MIKIVAIALVCALILSILKYVNSELFVPGLIATGVIIISFSLPYLSQTIVFFREIYELTNLDGQMLKIIIKIIAIAYLVEIASGTIEDMGLKGVSDKLALVGKVIIITISMPILYSLLNIIKGMLL